MAKVDLQLLPRVRLDLRRAQFGLGEGSGPVATPLEAPARHVALTMCLSISVDGCCWSSGLPSSQKATPHLSRNVSPATSPPQGQRTVALDHDRHARHAWPQGARASAYRSVSLTLPQCTSRVESVERPFVLLGCILCASLAPCNYPYTSLD